MRNCTITRVFHPIGQGAFYSETYDTGTVQCNIVYDCGVMRKLKKANLVVEKSFKSGSVIDILFISHFDFDHISKIDELKKHFAIKTCVLPLLYQEQKEIMKAFYHSLNQTSMIDLIDHPQAYFGDETQIIYVISADDQDKNDDNDNRNPLSELSYDFQESHFKSQNSKSVDSGTKIKSGTRIAINEDWNYVPYNINYDKRNAELKKLFDTPQDGKTLDFSKFKTSINYAINNRQQIKKIYDKLEGGINVNSMLLYSGPKEDRDEMFSLQVHTDWYGHRCYAPFSLSPPRDLDNIAACIFTGDTDFHVVDIKKIFQKYWKYVGTIQLPHHGSEKSFDLSFINDNRGRIFPVSYGKTNSYGHPASSVITAIISRGSCVVDVNEDEETRYTQIITKNDPNTPTAKDYF